MTTLDIKQLFQAHAGALRGVARRLGAQPADVDDLVADTLVRALTRFDRIRADGARAYPATILRNLHRDLQRGPGFAAVDPQMPCERGDVAELAELQQRARRVAEVIERLNPGDRELLRLHAAEGWDYARIGARFGITPGNARVRAHRARLQLTQWMEEYDES